MGAIALGDTLYARTLEGDSVEVLANGVIFIGGEVDVTAGLVNAHQLLHLPCSICELGEQVPLSAI